MPRIKTTLLILAALAAAAFGLFQHVQVMKLREENDSIRQQTGQLAAENERLTNSIPQTPVVPANNQMGELLRLRGEVAALRKQTNELAKLRVENGQMRASLANARPRSQSSEEEPPPNEEQRRSFARLNDSRAYVLAMIMHAADNQDRFATNLDQVTPYFSKEHSVSGTNQFDIMFQGSAQGLTNTSSIILLRERQPRQQADGPWTRAYGFLDGHSEIHTAPDGNFDTWEREHLFTPNPAGR